MIANEVTFSESLAAIRESASAILQIKVWDSLPDDGVLSAQRTITEARGALDAAAAALAGEVAHRSRRELGYGGLAQRHGFRTAEKLVQHNTGSTARDAATLVTVGSLVRVVDSGSDDSRGSHPWLVSVGVAVRGGALSVASAKAIRDGIGGVTEGVTLEMLTEAVNTLVAEAPTLDADQVLARARQLRDDLDVAGVAHREQQIREKRSFRRVRRPNGVNRYILDPDIETAAFLDDLYDRVTAPRRGNVTFLRDEDRAWAAAAAGGDADRRTVDQYVHDTFGDLLRIAVATDTGASRALIGSRQPAVRVLVTGEALKSRSGMGHIEGAATPVSLATVERIACSAGVIEITLDSHGNALDLGREQRLFSARQRIVLAARDGGCRMPGCERPPGWCEAHHIDHWERDAGRSDIDRGILLCRHHHTLVHNNGWEIEHDGREHWLTPPPDIHAEQTPRRMPSKSAALRELLFSPARLG